MARFGRIAAGWLAVAGLLAAALPARAQTPEEAEGYVLRVEGRLVFLDVGTQDNVHPNTFYHLARQETVIHPVTGENLGGLIPLGAIRVVEVFPRLATAEVVRLNRDMDLELLDQEARQGVIRVQPMAEADVEALSKLIASMPGDMPPLHAGMDTNPDGPIRALVPRLGVTFGSRVVTGLPDSLQGLLSASSLARADSTVYTGLKNPNSSRSAAFSLLVPLSPKVSSFADIRVGSHALLAVGARYYPGPMLRFLGKGRNPDGLAGQPSLEVSVGTGGKGTDTLPAEVEALIAARTDSTFLAGLDPNFAAPPADYTQAQLDSLLAVRDDTLNAITAGLRKEASDSLSGRSDHGPGFAVGVALPLSSHFTVRTGYRRFGSVQEVSGGLTYYMKEADPVGEWSNADGAFKSLVLSADAAYDTEASKLYADFNLAFPVSRAYTLEAAFLTDIGSYNRVGLALKGYLKGF